MGAIILDKAHIEHHVLVGAGSVVSPGKRLESGYLYVGSPAKQVRKLHPHEFIQIEESAKHLMWILRMNI